MPPTSSRPISSIPKGWERPVQKSRSLNLLCVLDVLQRHLTPALCANVYREVRRSERERKWTFESIVRFWTAMIVQQAPSLTHGIAQTRKRGAARGLLWPHVNAEVNAFFEKCSALHPEFFHVLYDAFTARLLEDAPVSYAAWLHHLRQQFPEILVVDGSNLDAVQHRLKLLRPVRAPVLPGCITVFYDLFRGVSRRVAFYPDAHESEIKRVRGEMAWIRPGSLILGDRLYGVLKYFGLLAELHLHGLFRRWGVLKIRRLRVLSCRQGGRSFLEDVLVEVGCGIAQPKRLLRLIRYRGEGRKLDLLTSVLQPEALPAEQAVRVYGLRWSVERLFLDLKKTLKLHGLYASHPNLVAQQLYATAIVYNAFRVAQARLASQAEVLPEQLSSEKLFPLLARSSNEWAVANRTMIGVREANPSLQLRDPDWNKMEFASLRLANILLQHRKSSRRKFPGRSANGRWKSFPQIRGGRALLRAAVLD